MDHQKTSITRSEMNKARKSLTIARTNARARSKQQLKDDEELLSVPKRCNLDPIQEHKERIAELNSNKSKDSPSHLTSQKTFVFEAATEHHHIRHHTDYSVDVDIGDRGPYDIQIIYGKNSVTVRDKVESDDRFVKVVPLPHGVDPVSLQCRTGYGSVHITGFFKRKHSWIVGRHGMLNVNDNGSAKVTLQLPKGLQTNDVHIHTVTKHYLVISESNGLDDQCYSLPGTPPADQKPSTGKEGKFWESFELPDESDLTSIETRPVGDSSVVIDIPQQQGRRNRTYTC